jgi:hypothetical protein
MAASIHGSVRASIDADAVLSVSLATFRTLERRYQEIGLATELREGDFADPIPALLELADSFGNRVDLLAGLRGLDKAAFSRAITVAFQGETLKVLSREDFIATKVYAGGPQDLIDAGIALKVAGEQLDISMLRKITHNFGADATQALEELLKKM